MASSKEIKHVWTVLCEKSSIDQQSNNASLFNVAEQINFTRNIPVHAGEPVPGALIPSGVTVPIDRELVTLWRRAPGAKIEDISSEAKVELVDPQGVVLETLDVPITFKHFRRLRTVVRWQNLRVTVAGEYFFRVLLRNGKIFELVAEVPLEITIRINGINEPQHQFAPSSVN